ncbi:MAG: hypothetical protein LBK54_01830 [Propionibacteriaceae bacterium]|jgi:hypothetical protein|nr:hypothetical protein [Propionibacteriaceae bacterium]
MAKTMAAPIGKVSGLDLKERSLIHSEWMTCGQAGHFEQPRIGGGGGDGDPVAGQRVGQDRWPAGPHPDGCVRGGPDEVFDRGVGHEFAARDRAGLVALALNPAPGRPGPVAQ